MYNNEQELSGTWSWICGWGALSNLRLPSHVDQQQSMWCYSARPGVRGAVGGIYERGFKLSHSFTAVPPSYFILVHTPPILLLMRSDLPRHACFWLTKCMQTHKLGTHVHILCKAMQNWLTTRHDPAKALTNLCRVQTKRKCGNNTNAFTLAQMWHKILSIARHILLRRLFLCDGVTLTSVNGWSH